MNAENTSCGFDGGRGGYEKLAALYAPPVERISLGEVPTIHHMADLKEMHIIPQNGRMARIFLVVRRSRAG